MDIMKKALEGIRVLDWTILQQGPMAGVMLGDLGAEVIKIESRSGDFGRPLEKYRNWYGMDAVLTEEPGKERNLYFETCNRNKKGITIDLKKPESREIIKRLVKNSDVLLQNFRVGVAERLGMDYKTLSAYNPRLIYVHSSGLGDEGEDAAMGLIDPIAQARTGIMFANGNEEPEMQVGAIADQMGGVMGAFAVLAGLAARERTGKGQEVQTSLMAGMATLHWVNLVCAANLGRAMPYYDRSAPKTNPLCNHYKCSDGKWVMIGCHEDRFWPTFCKVMELEELEHDPRFDTSNKRRADSKEFVAIVDKAFARRSSEEWLKLYVENGLLIGPVHNLKDLTADPQMWANGYMEKYHHPALDRDLNIVRLPIVLKDTPVCTQRPAPLLGEHNEEVLREVAGFTEEEIEAFASKEVI